MPVHACIVGSLGIFGKCRVAYGKTAAIGLHVDVKRSLPEGFVE